LFLRITFLFPALRLDIPSNSDPIPLLSVLRVKA
jgi:hypothetical protein